MRRLRRALRRLRDFAAGNRRDRDFSAELESHLQLHVDDNLRAGMTPAEARRRAVIALGGVEQTREQHRDAAGFRPLADLGRDLRLTARGLRRTPGFTLAAVWTLGIGIGVHTAVFSVVDGLVFRPSPFTGADRLVQVVRSRGGGSWSPSIERSLFETLVANSDIFEGVGTYRLLARMKVAELGGEDVRAAEIAPGFFKFLGVAPMTGREFHAADRESQAVILSHPLWRRVLGGQPNPIGKTITLEGRPYVVVGVMPRGVRFPVTNAAQLWLPARPSADFVTTVARLKTGLSEEEAQRRVDAVAARLQREMPRRDGWGAALKSEYHLRLPAAARMLFLLLVGAVGLVVLIACANVATLFLSRTMGRMKELEVRAALGATSWRLTRHVLLETLTVAALGGGLAVLLARGLLDAAVVVLPPEIGEPRLDSRAMWFAAGVVILAAVTCAIGPILRARRHDFSRVISSSRPVGRQPREARWYRRLVVAELSLTCVLLLCTGLLTNSFVRLVSVDVGFEPRHLALATIQLSTDRYPTSASVKDFFDEAARRVERVPGVVGVTAGRYVPPQTGVFYRIDNDAADDTPPVEAAITAVEPDFFEVLQLPVRAGRSFGPAESRGGALIVNDALARRYWPNGDAVGRRLRLQAADWRVVIGVVGDVKGSSFANGMDRLKAYVPLAEEPPRVWTIAARVTGGDDAVAARIRRSLEALDSIAVRDVSTTEDAYGTLLTGPRLLLGLMSAFTAGALLLALVGIYGLVSAFAASRKHELGIRVALGADAAGIRWLVVREAVRPALAGLAMGLAGGFAASTTLRGALFEITPHDPLTAVLVAAVLLTAVVLVAWLPARRAAAVDPLQALRVE